MLTFRRLSLIYLGFMILPTFIWATSDALLTRTIVSADSCMGQFNWDRSKLFLDSASLLVKQVKNPAVLGFYYQTLGNYYTWEKNESEAHKKYYQAIDYYEQSEEYAKLSPIFCNLAYSYYQKQDTDRLEKIISKMIINASKLKNVSTDMDLYGIMASYYHCLYEKSKKNTGYLDSIIHYENKYITDFETNIHLQSQRSDAAFNYMILAFSMLKSQKYDPDSVGYTLEKAKRWANPADTAMTVNLRCIEGEIAFDKKDFKKAEALFKQTLALLDRWEAHDNLSIYIDLYGRLSEIAEINKDFRQALHFEREKAVWSNKIHDAEKYKTIVELNEKYEAEKKDKRIIRLENDLFKERINRLYLGLAGLGLIASFFIIRWLLSRKNAMDSELLLAQTEKSEAELQARLKEEMLKKTELDKYESLLDNHFKNKTLSEMDDTLKGLRNEQHELNKKIQSYQEKLNRYEGENFVTAIEDPYFQSIAKEVNDLIRKRLKNVDKKPVYFEALQKIKNQFFLNLQERYQGKISGINLKYCICFAIGMDAQDISDCFCVELRSVHTMRHRLRSKLNVDKTIDFNLFLRKLNDSMK